MTAQRKQSKMQADAAVTANIQDVLRQRMQTRIARFGMVPL